LSEIEIVKRSIVLRTAINNDVWIVAVSLEHLLEKQTHIVVRSPGEFQYE
jgi:hypothetical protein